MANVKHQWSATDFDAISIRARDNKFTVKGTDGDQVKLEGNYDDRFFRNSRIGVAGRWLQVYTSGQADETELTLLLPRHKTWIIDLFCGRAQFKAENIHANMHLMFGKGEIQARNCQGVLLLASGDGEVKIKHFIETEVPKIPPLPPEEIRFSPEGTENWPDGWENYWLQMGGAFGEKILRQSSTQSKAAGMNPGLVIQMGKGEMQLENIEARTCLLKTMKGDAKLVLGSITNLDLNVTKGDIECESCLPLGDWIVRTNQGDIRLAFPPGTKARLDVATRQGEITTKTPLVRVSRQGPESWHGSRMVGTIGTTAEDKIPEIHASTLHGDIKIETRSMTGHHVEPPETVKADEPNSAEIKEMVLDTPLTVLTALREGRITIDEAEHRLHDLKF